MTSQLDRDLYCLKVSGCIVIRDAIDPLIVETIRSQAKAFEQEVVTFIDTGGEAGLRHSWPLRTTRCIYAISAECQDLIMSPTVLGIVRGYLGQCVLRDALLQTNMPDPRNAIRGPSGDHSFHRDTKWTSDPIQPQYLHVFLPLCDMDRENGSTVVVPGSHLLREPGYYFKDTDPRRPVPGIDYWVYEQRYFPSMYSIEARVGSLVFLDPMCIHSQGINASGGERTLLNMTFRASGVCGTPPLLNAKHIARHFARVQVREDLLDILEDDARLPTRFGPLGQ